MPDKNEDFIYYVLICILLIVAVLLWPVVLRSSWDWFLVPLGMKRIGYLHALGIHLTLKFFTWGYGEDSPKKEKFTAVEIFQHQLGRLMALILVTGFLYVVHLYAF